MEPPVVTGRSIYREELNAKKIRLVNLDTGYHTEQISCNLVYRHLDDEEPKYNALSYVWSDPFDARTIFCDG